MITKLLARWAAAELPHYTDGLWHNPSSTIDVARIDADEGLRTILKRFISIYAAVRSGWLELDGNFLRITPRGCQIILIVEWMNGLRRRRARK